MSSNTAQTYQKLKDLIESRPELARRLDGINEVQAASEVLAQIATEQGLQISATEIAACMQNTRQAEGRPDGELDDEMLEAVSGAGSPWCMWTKGCYCFFTK